MAQATSVETNLFARAPLPEGRRNALAAPDLPSFGETLHHRTAKSTPGPSTFILADTTPNDPAAAAPAQVPNSERQPDEAHNTPVTAHDPRETGATDTPSDPAPDSTGPADVKDDPSQAPPSDAQHDAASSPSAPIPTSVIDAVPDASRQPRPDTSPNAAHTADTKPEPAPQRALHPRLVPPFEAPAYNHVNGAQPSSSTAQRSESPSQQAGADPRTVASDTAPAPTVTRTAGATQPTSDTALLANATPPLDAGRTDAQAAPEPPRPALHAPATAGGADDAPAHQLPSRPEANLRAERASAESQPPPAVHPPPGTQAESDTDSRLQRMLDVPGAKLADRSAGTTLTADRLTYSAKSTHHTATPDSEDRITATVSRGLGAVLRQKGGSLTLQLNPPSLGQVRINMLMEQGAVSVRLEASNPTAHRLLNDNIAMLRTTLESKGMNVERLAVQLGQPAPQPGAAHSPSSQNSADHNAGDRAAGHRDAADGESRGRSDRGTRHHGSEHDETNWESADHLPTAQEHRASLFRLAFQAVG